MAVLTERFSNGLFSGVVVVALFVSGSSVLSGTGEKGE